MKTFYRVAVGAHLSDSWAAGFRFSYKEYWARASNSWTLSIIWSIQRDNTSWDVVPRFQVPLEKLRRFFEIRN